MKETFYLDKRGNNMLIICNEYERIKMRNNCQGNCNNCVFDGIRCPIEHNMCITEDEINEGKNLEVIK